MDRSRDEELLREYRETGEICHFEELVSSHIGRVRAMIYPMVLNDADADDLTQDVFLRVAKNIDRFRGTAKFSSWLHRIAINTTYSFLRRRAKNPVDTTDDPPEQASRGSDPSDAIGMKEACDDVSAALAALSPILRSAIVLTSINGMSVRDAAVAEGCLAATMYWRVHHARKLLKDSLRTWS